MRNNDKVISYLKTLKNTNVSSSDDDYRIEKVLKLLGYDNAIVTCGVCYLDGTCNPISIHEIAGILYNKFIESI